MPQVNEHRSFLVRIPSARNLKRAIVLVWKAAPRWTCLNFVLVGLQAGMPLLQLYLMKLMVDAVTAGIAAPEKTVALRQALILIGLTGGVALAAMFLASIAKATAQTQTDIVTDHVQDMLHGKSVDLDLEYYEDYRFYDTLHRAQQEAPFRPTRIVNGLTQVVQNGVSLFGIAVLLFSCHWGIAAILFLAMLPDVFVRLKFADKMYAWKSKRSVNDRIAGYWNWVLTGETHAKEIRMSDLGGTFTQRFRDVRRQLREERVGIAFSQTVAELGAQAAAIIAIFGSLAFIAYRTVQGIMTLGDMVMYYQAFQRGQGYLRETLGGMADLYENNLFLCNFYDFLDLKPTISEPHPAIPVPKPIKDGIVFEHVSFRYPTGAGMVLKDINLTIRPGQVVAFVGENGSGKTTLAKLLCRLYEPSAGAITVDGIDLRCIESKALRREIGIIFQDYARYEMTARENIWAGNIRLPLKDEKIIEAARRSGAHAVMAGLPQGYDTALGKRFEHGAELSVGQWQKVALARAFLRDAQIIVLDEPTSSMDAKAEYAVFKNFRQLVTGRTGILISHRFSSIRMADRIYVLQGGKIIEEGSHQELIRCGGTYAQLFEIQAQFYR